jgi:hypothetical protein
MTDMTLPGAELIKQGLADLARREETIEALLVSISAPRLHALGMDVSLPFPDAELRLYHLLSARHGAAAHSMYNALIRRVVSFQRAAACAN